MLCLRLPGALLPDNRKIFYIPARIKELININREVRHGGYTIVHIHYGYLGLLGILGRYPFYLHLHGGDIRGLRTDPIRWLPTRESVQQAKKCFYVTPDLADELSSLRKDAIFLPNPIFTDRFKPDIEATRKFDLPRILIISALSPNKGVSIAFEAIQLLRVAGYKFHVSAIAVGSEKDRYLHFPEVRFYPEIPYNDSKGMNIIHDQEMNQLINTHDIVIGQLVIGSLGLAELEAMACGKPVVCYYKTNNLYPEDPPILSAKQPEQVANYLSQLIDDLRLRAKLGTAGREWVVRHHDALKIARELVEVYRRRGSDV
jgi:glycosyltransferase involved in cell wall biosynthesis